MKQREKKNKKIQAASRKYLANPGNAAYILLFGRDIIVSLSSSIKILYFSFCCKTLSTKKKNNKRRLFSDNNAHDKKTQTIINHHDSY